MAPVPGHTRRASGTAWALTFLTTLSSVAFAIGAIAGWVLARGLARTPPPAPAPARPARVPSGAVAVHPVAAAPVLTPEQAWGRELLDWRTRPRRRHDR